MPDTKSGRERNGRNKRRQLTESLYHREIEAVSSDEDLPDLGEEEADGELLADELPEERTDG
ncbi:MAG: hypothetical protein ABEJ22_09500 [Haloferacaceae archaeon]